MGYTPHVLVVGGGVTGTAIARDLAIRGLDVTLVEQGTLTSGATGRMQGLLYSGARYASTDPTVARQCVRENRTLREIAGHCVGESDGLLVTRESDGSVDELLDGCEECGIPTEELSGEEARSIEPAVGGDVERAVRVPDRTVDPFRLTVATARSAAEHGAEIRTHTEVTDVIVADGAVEAVTVEHDPGPPERERGPDDGSGAAGRSDDGSDGEQNDASGDGEQNDASGDGEQNDASGDGEQNDASGDSEQNDASGDEGSDESEGTGDDRPVGVKEEGAWGTGAEGKVGPADSSGASSRTDADEDDTEEGDDGAMAGGDGADSAGEGDASDTDADDSNSADGGDDPVTDGGEDYPGSDINPINPGGSSQFGGPPGMPGTAEERPERPTASVETIEPDYVINATGAWADRVAGLAGFEFPMNRSRAAMAVTRDCPVERPVTEGTAAETARTVVPHGEHSVIGATSEPADGPDDFDGETAEVDRLLDDLAATVPAAADADLLRSFWGVRSGPPRAGSEGRRFAFVDHADRDGCWGLTTVVGGTLTTHRLVAERISDHVCGKFGITRECRTDELPLPGSEKSDGGRDDGSTDEFDAPSPVAERDGEQSGDRAGAVPDVEGPNPIVCETRSVTRAEIREAFDDAAATDVDLNDVRIRTSAAMGACQGGRCAHRIAAELYPDYDETTVEDALDDLLAERWKGQRPALWGEGLAQAARNYEFHASTLSRKYHSEGGIDIEGFDDGPPPDDGGPAEAVRRGVRR